jgi:transketolase
MLFSSALFLFSKNKPMKSCKYEITGVVKETKDENGLRLYIESKDNKIFYPQIEQDNIVIASGAKVQVCYDAVKTLADNQVQIRISDVVYLP